MNKYKMKAPSVRLMLKWVKCSFNHCKQKEQLLLIRNNAIKFLSSQGHKRKSLLDSNQLLILLLSTFELHSINNLQSKLLLLIYGLKIRNMSHLH